MTTEDEKLELKPYNLVGVDVDRINHLYDQYRAGAVDEQTTKHALIEIFGILKRSQVIPFSPYTNT